MCCLSQYFETDDPELFKSKILFIRDHNVDEQDLELVFADEEYTPGSNTPKVSVVVMCR